MNDIQKLHYWTFKILPLAYDDSLSYYEVLAKVTSKLNEVIGNVNEIPDAIKEQLDSDSLANKIMQNLAKAIATDEGEATFTATAKNGGELIWLNGVLYEVVVPMAVGTNYVVGSNINEVVLEDILNHMKGYLSDKNEFYAERSTHDYDTGVYLYWKDNLYVTTADIKINDILYDDGDSQNLKEVNLGDEISSHYQEMHDADINLQTQIDENENDIETKVANEISRATSAEQTITNNLNNEITRATNRETNIDNRISNIVSQAGDDNTEVTDARKWASRLGESTSTTLGDAIREQINASTLRTSEALTDANEALPNSIYTLAGGLSDANLPNSDRGVLISLVNGKTLTDGAIQIFYDEANKNLYWRRHWSSSWNAWTQLSTPLTNLLVTRQYTATPLDLNEVITTTLALANRTDFSETSNYPANVAGTLLMLCSTTSKDASIELYLSRYNQLFFRTSWSGSFTNWTKVATPYNTSMAMGTLTSSPNELPSPHGIYIYNTAETIADMPENAAEPSGGYHGVLTSFCYQTFNASSSINNNGSVQIYYGLQNNAIFYRCYFNNRWYPWVELTSQTAESINTLIYQNDYKQPLIGMFTTIGVIGDSLASGECYTSEGHGQDFYQYSWLQYMCKQLGITGYNCSQGGLTTASWFTSARGLTYAQANPCQCYIIGLGQNDSNRSIDIGTIDDIQDGDNNAETFYGNYGKIITNLKSITKGCKIFALTDPIGTTAISDYNTAIREIVSSGKFTNLYLIDLANETDYLDSYIKSNKQSGHYTPAAYNYMAQKLTKLLSDYIFNNPDEFKYTAWIGTDYAVE